MNHSETHNKYLKFSFLKIDKKRFVFYLITLAAIIIVYLRIDELNLIADIFKKANFLWLFAMIFSQSFFYVFLALNYKYVLKLKNSEVPYKELFPMSIVVQFINQVLPSSSISGQAFFVYYLRKYDIPIPEAIGRAILEIMTLFMAFGTFIIISVLLMGREGIFAAHPEALIIVYLFLFMAVFWVGLFFLLQRKWFTEGRIVRWLARRFNKYARKISNAKNKAVRSGAESTEYVTEFFKQLKGSIAVKNLRRKGRIFWMAYLCQCLSLFANVFTVFFAARAIGISISFEAAFITFSLARFTAAIAMVPGGIGIYETVSSLTLVIFGLTAGAALAISLVTRAITFWLPIPIGWLIYKSMSKRIEGLKNNLNTKKTKP